MLLFRILSALILASAITPLQARTLEVGPGKPYASLQDAASSAQAGDTINIASGTYGGGQYITGLQGRADAHIVIRAARAGSVLFQGSTEAWHLTDVAYLRIEGMTFEGQTGNGVNIDDGGSYDTPSHHIVIDNCRWGAMQASGNNDQLKMSGVDYFEVRNCEFTDGSAGGSMIDMVGCHLGLFICNRFLRAGSNCIQAKGGSSQIRIEANAFLNGGERAINIGGSTGEAFFRPLDAAYEAAEIAVYSNWFRGAVTPIAFVGAVRCAVVNNTILLPGKWAMRILQESTAARFLPCGDNIFSNNIVFLGNAAANPTINVGPNTAPQSFLFSNNLWFNTENAAWAGPNLPATENNGLIGLSPQILDIDVPGSPLASGSPAIGRGGAVLEPVADFNGKPFATPRSVGSVEGAATSAARDADSHSYFGVEIFPNPASEYLTLRLASRESGRLIIHLLDVGGRELVCLYDDETQGNDLILSLPAGRTGARAAFLQVQHRGFVRVLQLRFR